jgi:hypothetical protein
VCVNIVPPGTSAGDCFFCGPAVVPIVTGGMAGGAGWADEGVGPMEGGCCGCCGAGAFPCAANLKPMTVLRPLSMLYASWTIPRMVCGSCIYRGFGFLLSSSWNLVEAIYHASNNVSYVLRLRNEWTDHSEHSSDNILFPQSGKCDVYILLNVRQHHVKTF